MSRQSNVMLKLQSGCAFPDLAAATEMDLEGSRA